jgi:hypothetical protein
MSAAERVPMQASGDRAGAWLYGRWTDLLLGCGLSYLLSLPLLYAVSASTGTWGWPNGWVVLFALLINGPHYGATILRVYESGADRRKYAVFAVYVTLAIAVLFAASSRSVGLASVLITAYLTWSPWHFSGQNYGLALMFLRRRGIAVDAVTKRLVYASFVLSAALAILAIHGGNEAMVFAPNTIRVANAPQILKLSLPAAVSTPLSVAVLVAYLACLGAAGWRLTRNARLSELGPSFLLVLTQAMWFTVPALVGSASAGTLMFSAIWISVWHSLQYLWVTTYYAKSSERSDGVQRFLLKSLVAGTAVQALPGVAMSPQFFGTVPWDAGLAATLFAVVNLHHFVLDGAIWKLRDGRVARVLLRAPEPAGTDSAAPAPRRPWLPALVWGVACLGLLVPLGQALGRSALDGPLPEEGALRRSLSMLQWTGRETTKVHYRIGTLYARQGDHDRAIAHFERSVELFPTAYVWFALGNEYRTLGRWERAQSAFESAIALNPDVAEAHYGRAGALLAQSDALGAGSRDEARDSLEHALALKPGMTPAALALARLQRSDGRPDEAIATLERALGAAEPAGAQAIRNELTQLR